MQNRSGRDEHVSSSDPTNFQAFPDSEDVSLRSLIGRIVEKGFSGIEQNKHFEPTRPPHPTIIPFPVARPRLHGPQRGALRNKIGDVDDSGEEDEESEFISFHQMSAFADPVSRKQKTALGFSRWRELISNNDLLRIDQDGDDELYSSKSDTSRLDGGRNYNTEYTECAPGVQGGGNDDRRGQTDSNDGGPLNAPLEKMHPLPKKQREENLTRVSGSVFYGSESEHGTVSLEHEIDQENQALLQSMSPEEIAEALATIKEKMDPSLQKLLKRRGKEKMRRQNLLNSEVDTAGQSAHASSNNQPMKKDNSDLAASDDCKNIPTGGVGHVQKMGTESQKVWNAWSERVEAVRRLRFSLEGTITEAEIDAAGKADEVVERDFLRTEGDPGAVGYTINEAVQLTRSVIPGQRSVALHLLASVLDRAVVNFCNDKVRSSMVDTDKSSDWEAIWAFALGPEPELVLTARMCLDDNHSSVVLACAKVIRSIMSCDLNEIFFDVSEKTVMYEKYIFTAPIFRSKPGADVGFFPGGVWKYSAKPSDIFTSNGEITGDGVEEEEEATIKDDMIVAGRDFSAGLVRMGILHRMHFLLEADPSVAALEESIIAMLIAIVRHSPTCANAVMKCPNLVETVVSRYATRAPREMPSAAINSVKLLRVLAQSDKRNCATFVNNGYFQAMTQNLFHLIPPLGEWIQSGMERCRRSSSLMVEQLRFWKVCLHYGFCIACFTDIFPVLCLWLTAPTLEKLVENNVLREASSVSAEAYLVLEALARTLPNLYSREKQVKHSPSCERGEMDAWSWGYVTPVVGLALGWLSSINDAFASDFSGFHGSSADSILWLYLAIMRFISTVLERIDQGDAMDNLQGSCRGVPWLPEFVPKILLEIIGNDSAKCLFLIDSLCNFRQECKPEKSLASVRCIEIILRVVSAISALFNLAREGAHGPLVLLDRVEEDRPLVDTGFVQNVFMNWVLSEWHVIQSIEAFGRGGPSPGVGLGWGASGGGYWSASALLTQADARLLILTLKMFDAMSVTIDLSSDNDDGGGGGGGGGGEMMLIIHKINSVLGACLTFGPRDGVFLEMAFDILFHVSVLRHLAFFIRHFHRLNNTTKLFLWEYQEGDYIASAALLASHFKGRWLAVGRKLKPVDEKSPGEMTCQDRISLAAEWAGQRLPLPPGWFLSPIYTVSGVAHIHPQSPIPAHLPSEAAKSGLFFLLGLETMSSFLPSDASSPLRCVPLVWKLHALSATLLAGLHVLEDNKSRAVYEALQEYYARLLGEAASSGRSNSGCLRFRSDIHENYAAFLDVLVGQYAAVSYGDLCFGRQISVYLHRETESSVRIAAWNALANARVLDILPPLEKCFVEAERYLEPCDDDEDILEAYVKAWVSGALDRAKVRGTMAFALVLHHLSSFIFLPRADHKIALQNKIARSLMKAYSQKQQRREGMMLDLIQYHKQSRPPHQKEASHAEATETEMRLALLAEACGPNSHLLVQVQKLRSALENRQRCAK